MAKRIERTAEIFEESERIAGLFAERERAAQRDIPVDQLLPNRNNPRQGYSEDTLDELVQSIQEHGFIGALDGRELPDGRVELAYGSRRLLAARKAGVAAIPVFLHPWDDSQLLFVSLVENLVREDLSLHEQAETVGRMNETLGFSVRELARKLGKPKSWVEDRLALYRAPADVKAMVAERPDTARAASQIARLPDEASRRALEQSVLDGQVTTRQVQQAVQQVLDGGLSAPEALISVTPPDTFAPLSAETPPAAPATEQTRRDRTPPRPEQPGRPAPGAQAQGGGLTGAQLLLRANHALDRFDPAAVQAGELPDLLNQLEQIVARAAFLLEQLKEQARQGQLSARADS